MTADEAAGPASATPSTMSAGRSAIAIEARAAEPRPPREAGADEHQGREEPRDRVHVDLARPRDRRGVGGRLPRSMLMATPTP